MFSSIAIALLVAVSVQADGDYIEQFNSFKAEYNKQYATAEEESQRLRNFIRNMENAKQQQAVNPHARFGVNVFSDLSAAELKKMHSGEKQLGLGAKQTKPRFSFSDAEIANIKDTLGSYVDWRNEGVVTPVKNQGQCGCCWAFSSAANIESQWAIAGHALVSLSPQQLVSCDTTNDGCNGGIMDTAWAWLIDYEDGVIDTWNSYPFVSGTGYVPACQAGTGGAQISSYQNVAQSEPQMAAYVAANGPISIAVDATSFETYQGGIITNCVSQQVDHAVVIVGFDTSNSPPYWIIKNSWGATWGEAGYVFVEYGADECLITSDPCSALV